MDIEGMHIGFKVELDKTSSLELPSFEPEEIDYWLNLAQKQYVEERVNIYNQSTNEEKVIIKIQDDIRPLFSYDTLTIASESLDDLSNDYWFLQDIYVTISKTSTEFGDTLSNETVPCDIINETDVKKYMETPTHKPYFDRPKFVMSNNSSGYLNIIVDAFTTLGTVADVFYIRKPIEMSIDLTTPANSIDCELPEHTHHNIISLAVKLALENIESTRFQTNSLLVNNEI